MRTIHKYALEIIDGPQEFVLPSGALLTMAGEQYGKPTLWFEVDTSSGLRTRAFHVVGTGHEIPANGVHVGSLQMPPMVWHIYEANAPIVAPDDMPGEDIE